MSVQAVSPPDLLLVPPLDLPLRLRLASGQYGALRPKPLPDAPQCFSTQIIPADDPNNPTGQDAGYVNQLHEAVDLAATAGDCVYAAYAGRIVEVETAPGRGNVTIDHYPRGRGLVTRYLHVTDIRVAVGQFVQKGTPIASVSAEPVEPHLHFELWASLAPGATEAPADNDLVPLDPTRRLYRWEETVVGPVSTIGPLPVEALELTRIDAVPFVVVVLAGATERLHVPQYPPVSAAEQRLVELARDARSDGRTVRATFRASAFWGVDVLTELVVA